MPTGEPSEGTPLTTIQPLIRREVLARASFLWGTFLALSAASAQDDPAPDMEPLASHREIPFVTPGFGPFRPGHPALSTGDEKALADIQKMMEAIARTRGEPGGGTSPENEDAALAEELQRMGLDPTLADVAMEYARRLREGPEEDPEGSELVQDLQERTLEFLRKANFKPRGVGQTGPGTAGGSQGGSGPDASSGELPGADDHLRLPAPGPGDDPEWSEWATRKIDGTLRDLLKDRPDLGEIPGPDGESVFDLEALSGPIEELSGLFQRARSRGEAEESGGTGGSGGGLASGLAGAVALAGILVVLALLLRPRKPSPAAIRRAHTVRLRRAGEIRSREGVVAAFHALVSLALGEGSDRLSHLEAREALSSGHPERADEIAELANLYAWCRYAPPTWSLEPGGVERARHVLAELRPLVDPGHGAGA
ncbi:MAG: hypothetical protein HY720_30945 [Planctomycetes bacterium]|nr:hypothetical protein [Planctomycetota bacterium]